MFQPRPCGCKGVRSCLLCEKEFHVNPPKELDLTAEIYEYCYKCSKAYQEIDSSAKHENHTGTMLEFPGVLLIPNFITEEEERQLVEGCDSMDWDLSQSGRRKQNFGPKTNFKKRKIRGNSFNGFPAFSKFAQEKLQKEELLWDFQTIEQCAIEYRLETGSSIDPHIDDCWVWGERVITINLLSDSVLTMTRYTGSIERYNLQYAKKDGLFNADSIKEPEPSQRGKLLVRIPMPRLSLLVLYGPARYEWEHGIYRSDITGRRICMAYREFTREYLNGGQSYESIGKHIISKAQNFW